MSLIGFWNGVQIIDFDPMDIIIKELKKNNLQKTNAKINTSKQFIDKSINHNPPLSENIVQNINVKKGTCGGFF
ncbi:hypothetical protein HK099_000507 [Clydaea vesicula]|uniref:Uncharacterized protein n=1 Tax=Clydaea vesicula TaxID=447962 RepID=A0AAD5TUN9_9FUNG|nr:hypothetical protein HK099_000507 [Clydaea vesicula]